MVFWRRYQHPLPKFPASVRPAFRGACEALDDSQVDALRQGVAEALEQVKANKVKNPAINIRLAEQIAERCNILLDRYLDADKTGKALIVGAVRYFAAEADAFSDLAFASGLDDDAQVVNHVLERIGIEDKFIDVYY